MPLLGGLLVSLFAGIAGFFAQWLTKKIAFVAASLVVFAALLVAFMALLSAVWAALSAAFPANSYVLMGFWMVVPDNFAACTSALITGYLARAAYDYNVSALKIAAYAN